MLNLARTASQRKPSTRTKNPADTGTKEIPACLDAPAFTDADTATAQTTASFTAQESQLTSNLDKETIKAGKISTEEDAGDAVEEAVGEEAAGDVHAGQTVHQ